MFPGVRSFFGLFIRRQSMFKLSDFGSLKGALAYGLWCRFSLIPLAK
jgi:hypothetical protein